LKPKNITHIEAASIPLVGKTALQALDMAEAILPEGLKGKTVFIPGALSGTGSFGLQLAKNVFGAEKVITTASTPKVSKVASLLGDGVVDQIVNYTVNDPLVEIPKGSVDFLLDTMGQFLSFLPLMKKNGEIVSIASVPSGKVVSEWLPGTPFYLRYPLDLVDSYFKLRARLSGVSYDSLLTRPIGADLDRLCVWLKEGKIRPVVGRVHKLSDLEAVREACCEIQSGKGSTGKFVIEID
jgi:NADPH:quinone reductase-like Zn-dependent oxidoreductase